MGEISDEHHVSAAVLPPAAGRLLVASPSLQDPNFLRTVVLLLDVDASGSLGVVINRPSDVDLQAVLEDWSEIGSAPGLLFHGGPVETDSALAVARIRDDIGDDAPVGWRRVFGTTGLVDLDTPLAVLADSLASFRVFAGYAGWSGGQLEAEIAEGAWHVVPSEPSDPFHRQPLRLWSAVLRRQGGRLAMLATWPVDVQMN